MKKHLTVISTDKNGISHVTRIHGGLDVLDQVVSTLARLGHSQFEVREA